MKLKTYEKRYGSEWVHLNSSSIKKDIERSKSNALKNKQRIDRINSDIETYKNTNNIQIKCLSDRILLYLRYGMDTDPVFRSKKNDPNYPLEPLIMELYYKIRGETEYTVRKPAGMAAAILYISSVMNGIHKTQREIAELFGVSEVSIRNNYLLLKKKLNL